MSKATMDMVNKRAKHKTNHVLFCILLEYSYLCSRIVQVIVLTMIKKLFLVMGLLGLFSVCKIMLLRPLQINP